MANIKFSIAARTDVGCVRKNNEDNFQAAVDLTQQSMGWINNQTCDLGEKGALLVVADGMGGMNAGEVASEIAIQTVKDFFTPERITSEVTKTRFTIEKYLKDVVVEADNRIKKQSTDETRGMGTTIVIAWLYGEHCYICWCGDSRAYIYNPANGLFQISKDHSYVQTLVDAGKISEDDAFDYPDSNVITRCLCDEPQKAEPECMLTPQPLCDGDIIMLCSDGLSGMIRDRDIQQIISANINNVDVCVSQLIEAALRAGGNDNVTIAMARIESGGKKATADRVSTKTSPQKNINQTKDPSEAPSKSIPSWLWGVIGFMAATILAMLIYLIAFSGNNEGDAEEIEVQEDVEYLPEGQSAEPAVMEDEDMQQNVVVPAEKEDIPQKAENPINSKAKVGETPKTPTESSGKPSIESEGKPEQSTVAPEPTIYPVGGDVPEQNSTTTPNVEPATKPEIPVVTTSEPTPAEPQQNIEEPKK